MKYLVLALILTVIGCGTSRSGPFPTPTPMPPPPVVVPTPVPGPAGPQGATGAQGPQGATGSAGTSCTTIQIAIGDIVLPTGGAVITCGITTALISNGTNGLDATPIEAVQLCPNYTTTYPSSFPEFAFCLNSNLYGVYWTGTQAFLAEIVPGVYASTSPEGCNFTVAADCKITN